MNNTTVIDIVNGPNGFLALGVFCLMLVLRMSLRGVFSRHWPERLLPVFHVAAGIAGSFAGLGSGKTIAEKLVVGVIAGAVALTGIKIGRTTVMGLGVEAPRTPKPSPSAGKEAPPR